MTTFGKECVSLYLRYENQSTSRQNEIVRPYWINEWEVFGNLNYTGHRKEEQRKEQNKELE